MIRQFTYTASPWGASGPGWMVFQQSKGVSNDEVKSLYPSFQYDGICAENGAVHFIQFVYQQGLNGKGAVLSQTTFTDTRWWGEPRPGDFFAHVLLADEVALAVPDFNPFCLYRSPDLQEAFPDALKDKALKIYRHEIPNEKPPELSALTNFAEIRVNDSLRFDAVLKRVPDAAIQKLGTIVSGLMHRPDGIPLVFDCMCAGALDVWTLAFHLCPVEVRRHLWLAFGFSESALKRLPNFSKFAVYGTKRKNGACDSATGLYEWEKLPQGKLSFQSADDIARFKEMLDACGNHLDVGGFDRLVDCWRIMTGDEQAVSLIKEAAVFIKGHEKLMSVIRAALMDQKYETDDGRQLRREQLRCVARYELGLIEDVPESCMEELARGGKSLESILGCLSESAMSQFLGDLYRYAQGQGTLAELAKVYLAVSAQGKCRVSVSDAFVQRVQLFDRIRKNSNVHNFTERDLSDLRKLRDETGGGLVGLTDALARMEYESGLSNVNDIDSLEGFLARFSRSTAVEKRERDVLERLKPVFPGMTAADICKMVRLLANAGMSESHVLDVILQAKLSAEKKRMVDEVAMRSSAREDEWKRSVRSVRMGGWLFGALAVVVLWTGWHGARWLLMSDGRETPCEEQKQNLGSEPVNAIQTNATLLKLCAEIKEVANAVPCESAISVDGKTNRVVMTGRERKVSQSNGLEKVDGKIRHKVKKEMK